MSSEIHLRGLALDNTAPKKRRSDIQTLATVSDLTRLGIEPKTSCADSNVFNYYAERSNVLGLRIFISGR